MTKVVIIAGGLGTRLGEAAKDIPKAMVEINGKSILQRQIDFLKEQGLTDIVLRVRHKKEQIMDHFGDGKRFGVNIEYLTIDKPYMQAVRALDISGDYLLMNGDILFNADMKRMLSFHRRNEAYMTMGTTEVNDCSHYGAVDVRKNKVVALHEKNKTGIGQVNAGIYVISPQVNFGSHSMWLDFLVETVETGKMYAYSQVSNWIDIGTPEQLELAREMFR